MPKQQVTIEVDVPEGWELGLHNTPRVVDPNPKEGDLYSQLLVLRKAWQWPSWLKAEWIAMDSVGKWYAFEKEPEIKGGLAWINQHRDFDLSLTDFTPPPCTDWRQSKRRRPM